MIRSGWPRMLKPLRELRLTTPSISKIAHSSKTENLDVPEALGHRVSRYILNDESP